MGVMNPTTIASMNRSQTETIFEIGEKNMKQDAYIFDGSNFLKYISIRA